MADCDACGRPQPDVAYVCSRCADRTARQLTDAADLWPELDVTITRQARMAEPGPRPRGRAPAQPIRPGLGDPAADQQPGLAGALPVQLHAAEVRDAVRNTVTTWARLIAEGRGTILPIGRTPTVLGWLAGQLGWARYQRWAGECWDELGYACSRIAPAVDRPRPRVDAGLCLAPTEAGPCQQRLTATPASAIVRCAGCRANWSAVDRSEAILAAAADVLGTAAEVSAWLTIHGEPVPVGTIWSWASRHRLLRHGTDPGGAPRYRLGDVRRLAAGRRPRPESITV